ncbi:division/cell wall cluster transcriptional repressor MraZ [Porifericola rhodea]|uniref:division/cell wall cluster transcriptional repressor MraZ n=1 Tax=Porifericola rhodea TaxID=930972 RepID=UPI002665145E|nr:division/cell wall cluster transcriptional repressor MraZ [Porifericola rhodea]WKN33604.1 division/cell wall cluster transcriptional repressor MraZ [Porifericola rhodea]
MAIFTGEYECKMDAKGRLLLPAKVKAKLPECSKHEIVLSQGFEPCLIIYTIDEYNKVYEKFSSLSSFNEEQRRLQRNFFRGSVEVELDNMGRFLIPRRMAQYARLGREAIIAGNGKVLEIWNPVTYDDYLINDPVEYSDLAQKHLHKEHNGNTDESDVS